MADFQNDSLVAVAARVNGDRVLYVSDILTRWAAKGYIFSAGQGLEATDVDSVSTEADTTPTYSLQAPSGTTMVVIPLEVRLALTDDGGGLSKFDISMTKAAAQCATALTLTGTALNKQNHYTPAGQTLPQATALYTVTASALLTTDYIAVAHQHAVDAALTTGLPLPGAGLEWVVNLWLQRWMLTAGAAMLVHTYSAGSAGKTVPMITWAEVPYAELV